jgi:predicted DCC family thiol-disulfide oxidoreductase YuxK
MTPQDLDKTYLVVQNGVPFTKSSATFALMTHLKMPYRALRVFRIVPKFLRDPFYDLVARNRYKWFGQQDACFIAPAGQSHRFVNASSGG